MSGLVYQNYNNRCQGWVNPSNNIFGPEIISLSSLYSPAGSTSLVSINGANFYCYSTISFGTYNPTVYFINSNLIQFYVPSFLNSGTYPVQVFNGSIPSNIINYTIDNSSGYWLLNSNGNITNTNSGLTNVSALSRGVPLIITGNYLVPNNISWIICNSINSELIIILPTGNSYIGREITIRNISITTTIKSNVSNIISLNLSTSLTPQNIILPPLTSSNGCWATLVNYDGLNWMIMQSFMS